MAGSVSVLSVIPNWPSDVRAVGYFSVAVGHQAKSNGVKSSGVDSNFGRTCRDEYGGASNSRAII